MIKISGTNLELVKVKTDSKGLFFLSKTFVSSLRLKFGMAIRRDKEEIKFFWDLSSPRTINIVDYEDELWFLVKNCDVCREEISYDDFEMSIITKYLSECIYRSVSVAEMIVRATKRKDIIKSFYESVGTVDIRKFSQKMAKGEISNELIDSCPPSIYYNKREYSVYRLAKDLVGAKILLGEELEKYIPVTPSKDLSSNRTRLG